MTVTPKTPTPARNGTAGSFTPGEPTTDLNLLRDAVMAIPITAETPRSLRIEIGMSIFAASGGTETGLDIWQTWSAQGCNGETPDGCKSKWTSDFPNAGIRSSAGTVYWLARQHGWTFPPEHVPMSAEPADPLVLWPSAPAPTARALLERYFSELHWPGVPMLVHQQGEFFDWMGPHGTAREPDIIRAMLWTWLDAAKAKDKEGELIPYTPTINRVSGVTQALAALTQLSQGLGGVRWLDTDPQAQTNAQRQCGRKAALA